MVYLCFGLEWGGVGGLCCVDRGVVVVCGGVVWGGWGDWCGVGCCAGGGGGGRGGVGGLNLEPLI